MKAHPGGWLGLGSEGAPGALKPGLCLLQPSSAGQRAAENRVSDAGHPVLAPAVLPG